jgi:alkylhydroperoxidase family enzyme
VASHVVSSRRRGVTQDEIEALSEPTRWGEVFDAPTIAALRLADAMSDAQWRTLDPGLVTELQSNYDETALAEILLVCGQANLNNRVGNAAKRLLGPDEGRVPSNG